MSKTAAYTAGMTDAGITEAPSPEHLAERLEAADILPTHQRVEIARVLFTGEQHLSADQVLARVNEEEAHVSKATVYNTLNLFARKGLIREVIVDPSRVFYDTNSGPHHHFYNVDTGELHDIPDDLVRFSELPPLPEGTRSESIELLIRIRGDN